jgi:gas vesicle protein
VSLLIGTIITLVTNFALAPEKAKALWDIIKQVFNRLKKQKHYGILLNKFLIVSF